VSTAVKPVKFDLYQGGQLVRSTEIGELIIKLGTVASNHLQLEDEHASRHHAMIEVDSGGEVWVRDLGSRMGTFVNGEKREKAQLHTGDALDVGQTHIVVTLGTAAVEARPIVSEHRDVPPLKRRLLNVGMMIAVLTLLVVAIMLAR
jgi:pSer/pThr/pTyr-binding forkhead associated (FHA) protein